MWTQNEFVILKEKGPNLSSKDLALILNKTPAAIQNKLNILKIKKDTNYIKNLKKTVGEKTAFKVGHSTNYGINQLVNLDDLNQEVKQILLGSIFGDGSIVERNKRYYFTECHSNKQADYLKWKTSKFDIFGANFGIGNSSQMHSPSNLVFEYIYNLIYSENRRKKYLPSALIEKLDIIGLLIWYLDDGSYHNGSPSISSMVFSRSDIENAIKIMNKNMQLELKIRTDKHPAGEYHQIRIPLKTKKILFPKWRLVFEELKLPNNMRYKLNF